ncbi:hypothetical protein SAMN05216215_101540 [Saccharopolyspora shandongensis]|uniref:Uncharacterized protein n=1 Tax=Saccharopolyspora shandongensis TaxID=418495 RepID=A0A1H3EJA2_9PSEU|nr:hypothetical protein [Saccharopolyspora shandongensis]SDX78826.1 hypothetical protein SAMN05216215_101540 [Saccharopolyspora shandongensis]
MGAGGAIRANHAQYRGRIALRWRPLHIPNMDECPAGGGHAPVPKQGGGGRICLKCGESC